MVAHTATPRPSVGSRPVKTVKACNEEVAANRAAIEAAGETVGEFFHTCWWHSTPGQPTPLRHQEARKAPAEGEGARPKVALSDPAAEERDARRTRRSRHRVAVDSSQWSSSVERRHRRISRYEPEAADDVIERRPPIGARNVYQPIPVIGGIAETLNQITAPVGGIQILDPLGVLTPR